MNDWLRVDGDEDEKGWLVWAPSPFVSVRKFGEIETSGDRKTSLPSG